MERAPWHPRWPGVGSLGALLLPLARTAFDELPASLRVDALRLARKTEFHVTLLDRDLVARAQMASLPAAFEALDWSWRATGQRWLRREAKADGPAHSVVELIDMPAFARFRALVGAGLGETLPEAPAHVTLYVAGDPIGIGLRSQQEFARLRVRRL
jgi:hypothetical protein